MRITVSSIIAGLLIVFPLTAGNLVLNPGFDANIDSWQIASAASQTKIAYHDGDALMSPHSGSLMLSNVKPVVDGGVVEVAQCVPVTPGRYDLAAGIYIPNYQVTTGYAQVGVNFFKTPTCEPQSWTIGGYGTARVSEPTGRFVSVSWLNETVPADALGALVGMSVKKNESSSAPFVAYVDNVYFGPVGGCVSDERTLCLSGNRFAVTATYATAGQQRAAGHVMPLTADSGYLWFFDEKNIELIVKVLDACALNNRYWVFAGGLTNVNVVVTVTDTVTGSMRTYDNPLDHVFETVTDTNAFRTCP